MDSTACYKTSQNTLTQAKFVARLPINSTALWSSSKPIRGFSEFGLGELLGAKHAAVTFSRLM